jgi:putative endonuclease
MPSFWSTFGSNAETAASAWLTSNGYRILDRNWRRPWGELDIVACTDGVIRFIEVKASKAHVQGFEPYVRADRKKMLKVERTARTWLAAHGYHSETPWQMDVISVIMEPSGPLFEYFENI